MLEIRKVDDNSYCVVDVEGHRGLLYWLTKEQAEYALTLFKDSRIEFGRDRNFEVENDDNNIVNAQICVRLAREWGVSVTSFTCGDDSPDKDEIEKIILGFAARKPSYAMQEESR